MTQQHKDPDVLPETMAGSTQIKEKNQWNEYILTDEKDVKKNHAIYMDLQMGIRIRI